jgi:hypothetical protein
MELTMMGILWLGAKSGVVVLSVAGMIKGMNWLNKGSFKPKKKSSEEEYEVERG